MANLSSSSVFWSRLEALHGRLVKEEWCDVLFLESGSESNFDKPSAVVSHLFGVQVPVVLALAKNHLLVVVRPGDRSKVDEVSKKTAEQDHEITVDIETSSKLDSEDVRAKVREVTKGKKVGYFKSQQKNVKAWGILSADDDDDQRDSRDVTQSVGLVLSEKDEAAVTNTKHAAAVSVKVLRKGVLRSIENALDQDQSVTHEELAQRAEEMCEGAKKKFPEIPEDATIESCFFPIIQSGGDYDVRPSAVSTSKRLRDDVVLASLGARYDSYCASVSRTYFVDPIPKVKYAYTALLDARQACLEKMVAGQPLKAAYDAVLEVLKSRRVGGETLDKFVPKNVGFGLGIDFREAALVLNAKNQRVFSTGMTFALNVALHDVPLFVSDKEKAKGTVKKLDKFSLIVGDTVKVNTTTLPPEVLTAKAPVDWGKVSYFINEAEEVLAAPDDDQDDDDDHQEKEEEEGPGHQKKAKKKPKQQPQERKLRERENVEEKNVAARRDEKQAALMREKLNAHHRDKVDDQDGKDDDDDPNNNNKGKKASLRKRAYETTASYPDDLAATTEIHVDMNKEVVFIPMNGAPVPFHISSLKNSVQPESDKVSAYLRLNFYAPGQSLGKEAHPSIVELFDRQGKNAVFVKEMLFRSREQRKLNAAYRAIQELRKRYKQRVAKAEQEANLVQQETLVKIRDGRAARMADVSMKPMASGKKSTGILEAHTNGLRFVSRKNEVVDVMFRNVKHAFFQPCENEVVVLIHFRLKDPIVIGKKKSLDVQFYTDVVESSVALDASRRSMYDPDELDEEQRERQLRKKLNDHFKDFCKKVEKASKLHHAELEFDIPYRDLGFNGVPFREMVLLQPTVHCLVSLTETPFFVIELNDIEHVHFERCTLRSSNFDMVLVKKNFDQPPATVNAIPMDQLDSIQEWLTDMSLTYTAGGASLSWNQVMAAVRNDPRFFEDTEEDGETPKPAGWTFLQVDEEGDADDDGLDEDEDYEEEDADADADDDDDDDSDDEDDDDDFDDDDDDEEDEEEDEDAMDWDEMEEQAERDDKQKKRSSNDDSPAREKKRRK